MADKADRFASYGDSVTAPARSAKAIAPHDSNPLNDVTKAIYVGTGGDITLRCVDDTTDSVWKNVPSASILPVRASHVRATGTSAADLLAL